MQEEKNRLRQTAYGLTVLVLGTLVLYYGSFIFVPLIWGVFFAFALYPVSNWLEEKRTPRGLAIVVTLALFILSFSAVLALVLDQMVGLLTEIPEMGTIFKTKLADYLEEIEEITGLEVANSEGTDLMGMLINTENLNQTIFSTGKSLTLIGIIPLYVFLLIYYKDFFITFLLKASAKSNTTIITWANDSGKVIHQYLVGMIKVTLIVSLLAGIYFFAIGNQFYLLFALFIAVMNLIPYIGVVISSALVIFYVFLTTDTMFYPLLTLAVLWGIQLIENNLITPVIVGGKVKVNVLAVVLAILAGGALWGVSGMILSIPLIGIVKITLDRIPGMEPYGYLLGDDFPVNERKENFLKLIGKRLRKK